MSISSPPAGGGVKSDAEAIFYEVLELAPGDREAFLDRAAENPVLRSEVENLLRDHEAADGFMTTGVAGPTILNPGKAGLSQEKAGERIGNYRLLQKIGEGGFGVVWMAEQEQPVRRRVALKIIKLGMDTRDVVARFEQERQALAMMDHPNIARVLDAGATPTGRPYFVMELVRGIRITDYCDQANLPTAQRLRLFVAVCHAVQHAHQKGIIHRDLKPSNILVTLHDGVPVPKVIDFGVAKATQQQRLTDLTLFTKFEQMIGTPLYMSPEQAEMSGLDIDTRSDIYSLGVLLYELLAGRTPFDPQELMKVGYDEMRRVIREQEPQKPSTFVSTLAAEVRTKVAQHRSAEGAKLINSIRGDLDWIVMKALEKDRTRRYETANGLALDIQRHLADEPVQARPPSAGYRFRRMVRRNKAAFAAAAGVAVALLAGAVISTWQAVRATRAERISRDNERIAQTEAIKSEQVAKFLTDMLQGVGPSVAQGRDTTMLREILDKTAERVGTDLKDQPVVEANLREIIGNAYRQLGDYPKAEAMLRETLAIRKRLFGDEHTDVAAALSGLALAAGAQGNLSEAEKLHREALAMRRRLFGSEDVNVARSMYFLADNLHQQNKLPEAEALDREALSIRRKLLGGEHLDVANSLSSLSYVLYLAGKPAESETTAREAVTIYRKLYNGVHPTLVHALLDLGRLFYSGKRNAEAEAVYREALAMARKLYGNESDDVGLLLHNMAQALRYQGKLKEAEGVFRESLETLRKALGSKHPKTAKYLREFAGFLHDQDRPVEAEPFFRAALEGYRNSGAGGVSELEELTRDLADNLCRQEKFAEAEPLFREQIISRSNRLKPENLDVRNATDSLARMLTEWAWADRSSTSETGTIKSEIAERAREAESLLRDSLALRLKSRAASHWRTGENRTRLGGALVAVAITDAALSPAERLAKLTEAEPLLLEGHEVVQSSPDASNDYKRDAIVRIVRLYETWPKPDKAAEWQQKLTDFDKAVSLHLQAGKLRKEGSHIEAAPLYRDELSLWTNVGGPECTGAIDARIHLAETLKDLGKLEEAEPLFLESLAVARKHTEENPNDLEYRLAFTADLFHRAGKYAAAEPLRRELVEVIRLHPKQENERGSSSTASLARLLADWAWAERGSISDIRNLNPKVTERAREAERLLRECLAEREHGPFTDYWRTHEYRSRLGAALISVAVTDPSLTAESRLATFTEAETLLQESNKALQQSETAESRYKRDVLTRLVRLYEAWEKPDKVAEWTKHLADFDEAAAMRKREKAGGESDKRKTEEASQDEGEGQKNDPPKR